MGTALAIFGVVLSTLVLPLPEEIALLGAGFWAQNGAIPLWGAIVAAWLGNVVGDTASYFIGRYFLDRLLRTRLGKRVVSPGLRNWGESLVRRHGNRAILLGRFLVALRGPVYFAIGASKVPFLRFTVVNSLVGIVETGALVYVGYLFGQSHAIQHDVRWAEIAVGVLAAALLLLPPLVKRRIEHRTRAA